MNNLAPIVLFVYDRPLHTQKTVEALKSNKLASESNLYIYSDAPKNEQAFANVQKVREYIKSIEGFKKIEIIERQTNWGLAKSIIDGISKVIEKYGKIIVLEDDIVTSSSFLSFMNEALNFYEKQLKVWHISGWNYPMKLENDDVFLWRGMECWGWGTWKNRWDYFEKNPEKLKKNFTKKDIHAINLDGKRNVWRQVILNSNKKIDTWAVFWYATIFINNGLSVNPVQSFVKNIGFDGSGENCGINDIFLNNLNEKEDCFNFHISNIENSYYVNQIKEFSDKTRVPLLKRILKKLNKYWIK